MNQRLKSFLIVGTKNAVNAILTNGALMLAMHNTFHTHSREGWLNLLRLTVSVVASREAMVWGPKLLQWSQSNGKEPAKAP